MAVSNNRPLSSREYDLHLLSDKDSQPTSENLKNTSMLLDIKHITTTYSNPKGNVYTELFM